MSPSQKFCPKCKSEDVKIDINASASFGVPQMWKCNKCGYQNYLFPEKEKIKAGVMKHGK